MRKIPRKIAKLFSILWKIWVKGRVTQALINLSVCRYLQAKNYVFKNTWIKEHKKKKYTLKGFINKTVTACCLQSCCDASKCRNIALSVWTSSFLWPWSVYTEFLQFGYIMIFIRKTQFHWLHFTFCSDWR